MEPVVAVCAAAAIAATGVGRRAVDRVLQRLFPVVGETEFETTEPAAV
jgi:hypothetical protein